MSLEVKINVDSPAFKLLLNKISGMVNAASKPALTYLNSLADRNERLRTVKTNHEVEKLEKNHELEMAQLEYRALVAFKEKIIKEQENIERIVLDAAGQINPNLIEEQMNYINEDWVANFHEKAKSTSDSDLQKLWAKILAEEINSPGNFSKRTLNVVSEIDKRSALAFENLSGVSVKIGGTHTPIVYSLHDEYYKQMGLGFDTLSYLQELGLITCIEVGEYNIASAKNSLLLMEYFEDEVCVLQKEDGVIPVGNVRFTQAGFQIAKVCNSRPVNGFLDKVLQKMIEKELVVFTRLNRSQKEFHL